MEARQIHDVPIENLVWHPQVRETTGFSDEEIAGLAQSIAESGGIHQPLLARLTGSVLVGLDGERRWRAARLLGLKTVPVIIEEAQLSASDVTYRQLVLDAQRVGLSPIERARAINRLKEDSGWSAAQVAVKLGVSPSNVAKLLTLLMHSDKVQQQVASGRLAMSTAYELAKIADPKTRERLTTEAITDGLSRDGVAKKAKSAAANGKAHTNGRQRSATPRERVVVPLGGGRSVAVSGPGLNVESLVAWIEDVLARIRKASEGGRTLADVAKALAVNQK